MAQVVSPEIAPSLTGDLNSSLSEIEPSLLSIPRLRIMLELYKIGAIEYVQLRYDLKLSDGALASHLKVLEKAGLISSNRKQGDKEPLAFVITARGTDEFERIFNKFAYVQNRILRENPSVD